MDKFCVCRKQALYLCKGHQGVFCKKHRALHEEETQGKHIYEMFGQKFTAKRLAKIVDSLLSKIKIVDQCADQILENLKGL